MKMRDRKRTMFRQAALLAGFHLALELGNAGVEAAPTASGQPNLAEAARLRPPVSARKNTESFPPVAARYVRMTITDAMGAEACLDELEVYSAGSEPRNLALASRGAKATASGSLEGYAIHKLENVHDGLYGNPHSWVADTTPAWVQIELPQEAIIDRIVWGRDRLGNLADRVAAVYRLEAATDTNHWREVSSSKNRVTAEPDAFLTAENWTEFTANPFIPVPAHKNSGPIRPSGDYVISRWEAEDGLPEGSVTSIAQTSDGYLWLGTFGGLARFDGIQFKIFNAYSRPPLRHARVVALRVDAQDQLWIVDESRVVTLLAAGAFREPFPSDARPLSWAADRTGGLWVATARGVYQVQGEKLFQWVPESGIQPDELPGARLAADSAGRIWLCTQTGRLGRIHNRRFLESQLQQEPAPIHSPVFTPRRAGGFWMAEIPSRLRYVSENGQVQPATQLSTVAFAPRSLCEDRHGNLWIGTEQHGLYCRAPGGELTHFTSSDGLGADRIRSVFEDREGNIWVGTDGGGLNRIKTRIIRSVEISATAHAVCPSKGNGVWLGTSVQGACLLKDATVSRLSLGPNLDFVWSVLEDSKGDRWFGTYGQNLFRMHGDVWEHHGFRKKGGVVSAIFEDRKGTIWAGGSHGLSRWEDYRFVTPGNLENIPGPVSMLADDSAGTLWIGTSDDGLWCLRDGALERCNSPGLAARRVHSIYVSPDDVVWIGTFGAGMQRLEHGRVTTHGLEQGLPEVVSGIIEDDFGRLWISSARGICWVWRQEIDDVARGVRKSVFASHYGREDGMTTVECSGGSQSSVCKTPDGKLWFSTVKGLVVADPAKLVSNTNVPPVWIEEVTIDGAPVPFRSLGRASAAPASPGDNPVVAPPGSRRIEFGYTGLSLVDPRNIQFKCRLEGFEQEWVRDAGNRKAAYAGLAHGKYTFRVSAANNDGVWNDRGDMLTLVVMPYFWETMAFKITSGLSLGLLLVLFYQRRMAALEARRVAQENFSRQLIESQENERQRIAKELHDSVGQNLLLIRNQAAASAAENSVPPSVIGQLSAIAQMSASTVQEVRQISHDLRPPQFDEVGLTAVLENMIGQVARNAGLALESRIENIDGVLPPRDEISLFRVMQETLNNIVKHAGASSIQVEIARDLRHIELTIQDDGKGFDTASSRGGMGGMGMRNMRERVGLLGGNLSVLSEPGHGTKINIVIPIPG